MKNKIIKIQMEYILKRLPAFLENNPCRVCSLTVGRFNCLNRSLCESDNGFIWVIKNHKYI